MIKQMVCGYLNESPDTHVYMVLDNNTIWHTSTAYPGEFDEISSVATGGGSGNLTHIAISNPTSGGNYMYAALDDGSIWLSGSFDAGENYYDPIDFPMNWTNIGNITDFVPLS